MPMIWTVVSAALLLLGGSTVTAQTPARPANVAPAPPPVATADVDARATREQLRELMQRFPPDLGRVLKMDPTLLTSDAYLAQYPALASFLAAHPDVAHNPSYYLQFVQIDREDWQPVDARTESIRMYRNLMESVGAFFIFLTAAGLIAWFLRTVIDYRRWLRVSRVQTEVHNKLLERFAGTGDLMAYVQSPAGRRFLESAPIPLDPGPRSVAAPLGRILWSVQAGVVLTVVGLGFEVVSARVIEDIGEPLALIGVLAMALGVGFILSGGVSYVLSRRLGLLEPLTPAAPERHDSSAA
jgi:hypothetical protein